MSADTKRIILAGGLIFLVVLLQPVYFEWLGYNTNNEMIDNNIEAEEFVELTQPTNNNHIIEKK